jgi:predicted nuclease of restriction endonuclease-like (RecB) superfamily
MAPRRKGKAEEDLRQVVADLGDVYRAWVESLKTAIGTAQTQAALAVNRQLLSLYLHLGDQILAKQVEQGWGKSVVERLSRDLQAAFPGVAGFSARNLWDMRRLSAEYQGREDLRQLVADLPWGHNLVLMYSVKDLELREWYVRQAIHHGWSRSVLVHQIETRLFERQGKALTNFGTALPAPQSDLVQELLKDPYNFDFMTLAPQAKERDLERSLLLHLRDFLIELGQGFALVGSQYHLEVGGEDFYLDLLFYHLKLRCYVVIELKMGAFQPEYAGKMNFYLAAVDDLLRHPADQPSIGLILCKDRNRLIVEYALRDIQKPMGVAAYRLLEKLPDQLRGSLPTSEELEENLRS